MKKFLNYILTTALVLVVIISCRDEDAVRFPDLQSGVNARVVLYSDKSFINLDDINSASVAFDVYSESNDLDQIVYSATFTDDSNPNAEFPTVDVITVSGSEFVNGKATRLEVSAEDLATAFGFPGGVSYFEGGDKIVFETTATLKDGRILNAANSAPSINGGSKASFTTSFTTFVGCSSSKEAIEGTYVSTMVFNNFGIGIDAEVEVEVTFVGPEPFRYRVTDHTAELYTCCGGGQYPADFFDICGKLILQPTSSFGAVVAYTPPPGHPDASKFGSTAIDTSTPATSFSINWNETSNGILASVSFVKKVD